MTIVIGVVVGMLGLAGVLAVIRMTIGPTILDRIISLDVITAITVAGVATEAFVGRHSNTIPVLVVLALVGFVGSTSVARFAPGPRRGDR